MPRWNASAGRRRDRAGAATDGSPVFRRTSPPPGPAGLVPDPDALRQAALRASWARDRKVRQRRIAWRWLLWALARYVLPATGVIAVIAVVVHQLGWWHGPELPPWFRKDQALRQSQPATTGSSALPPLARDTFDTMPLKIDSRLGPGPASATVPDRVSATVAEEPARLRTAPTLLTNKEP